MLIAKDAVLTAGHCFCDGDYPTDCFTDNTSVTFRPDPGNPASIPQTRSGTVVVNPEYDPQLWNRQFEADLAIIRLAVDAPAHVQPLEVAKETLSIGSTAMIAGFGRTSDDCLDDDGASGTLNFDLRTVGGYEDDRDIIRFNDLVWCKGDSGGAVMDELGTTVFGVIWVQIPLCSRVVVIRMRLNAHHAAHFTGLAS